MDRARVPGWRWCRDRPVLAGAAPVLVLAVLTVLPALRLAWVGAFELVLSVLVWLPALARRHRPVAAFAVTAALVLAGWAYDGLGADRLLPAYAALWFGLFTLADRCDVVRTLLAAVACEAIAVITLFGPSADQGGPPILPLTTVTIAVAVLGRNRQTRRAYTAGLVDRAERLEREQDQQARVAVAEERARLAREVHDVVAHNISVMIALADGATYATTEPRAGAAIAQVAATGRQALTEMSRLLGVLREDDGSPSRRPAPGSSDLGSLVEQVRAAGLATEVLVHGTPVPLGATAQLAVYRLVQEALTNTLKHGREVRHARVELSWSATELAVQVTDDGRPTRPATPGHGITGMGERFGSWGGTVVAGPAAPGGWQVRARLPLADAGARPGPLQPVVPA